MLHYVMPGALGGPNVSTSRIEHSQFLKKKYDFVCLNQNRVAGGRISVSLILELKNEITKEQPDLIHISGLQSAGLHTMVAAYLAGCKNRLISTRGFSGSATKMPWWKRVAFNKLFEPLTLIIATHVHCISLFTQKHALVQRFAKHNSTQVYNLPPTEIENKKKFNRVKLRSKFNLLERDIIFVTVSRITQDKGYEHLAVAIKKFHNYSNIKFLIIGDGNYRKTFESFVTKEISEQKVMMLGSRHDVAELLKISDVFVLPTLHENLGNVFLEAGLAKLPTVATNVGGIPEVIVNGQTGLLTPPSNPSELFEAMVIFVNSKKQRENYGNRAYCNIVNNFDPDKLAGKYHKLYSSILKCK